MSGSFTLHEGPQFTGRRLTVDLDDHAPEAIHPLVGATIGGSIGSASYELPAQAIVALHERADGTGRTVYLGPGRGQGPPVGAGGNSDLREAETATTGARLGLSWRWTTLGAPRSLINAFGWIATEGRTSLIDPGSADIGNGHLQGVGVLDPSRLVVSSNDPARLTVIEWPETIGIGGGRVGEPQFDLGPFGAPAMDHAGGLQVADGVVAVGLEDDNAKDGSRIVLFERSGEPGFVELTHLGFDRPGPHHQPQPKRWTAGAVGLARMPDGHHLLIVGSWDSAELDFYRSSTPTLSDPATRFEAIGDWSAIDADRTNWLDENWSGYQALNLHVTHDGRIFFVGSHRRRNTDWIDLYRLELDEHRTRRVTKVAKRELVGGAGVGLNNGGGTAMAGGVMHFIGTGKELAANSPISVFDGPGELGAGLRGSPS